MDVFYVVWRFDVDSGKAADFEKAYSRSGPWFTFFEKCDDFLGLELIKNKDDSSYLVIDKWISASAYEDFRKDNEAEYNQLNEQHKGLYKSEERLGVFQSVGL